MSAILDPIFPECPVRNILSRLCDKWSLLIMHELTTHDGPMRFSQLKRCLPDISQKMLSATLKHLIDDGFVRKQTYPEVPPRTEYELTQRAASFLQACHPMVEWATNHFAEIINDRQANQDTP